MKTPKKLLLLLGLFTLFATVGQAGETSGGFSPVTLALSCQFQEKLLQSGGGTIFNDYRIKIDDGIGRMGTGESAHVLLYKKINNVWVDVSDLVSDMKPIQTFRFFAGITYPGINSESSTGARLRYYWHNPEPLKDLDISFDATKRVLPEGLYKAQIYLRFDDNSVLKSDGSSADCYADVVESLDPFAISAKGNNK